MNFTWLEMSGDKCKQIDGWFCVLFCYDDVIIQQSDDFESNGGLVEQAILSLIVTFPRGLFLFIDVNLVMYKWICSSHTVTNAFGHETAGYSLLLGYEIWLSKH